MHVEAAGEAVLVTFDRIGQTSRSFRPFVDGLQIRFTSAGGGKMKDNATGSVWDASSGECESGELKGKRLETRAGGSPIALLHRSVDDRKLAG